MSEYPDINALAVAAWQVLQPGYDPAQWETMLKAISGMSKIADSGQIFVATQGETLVGAVGYLPSGRSNPALFPTNWPSMRMLVVRPESRGDGLGRRLAEVCIERARADGARCIGLHTSPVMTVALPMYLRMGFVKDGDLPPIAGAPYERYVLWF